MRFTISSKELLARVQTVSRVINKKNTNATLNNIKFEIQEDGMVSCSYNRLSDNLAVASLRWFATATDHERMISGGRKTGLNHT